MTPAALRGLDAQVRANWTYRADPAGIDIWRSSAAEVMAGHAWSGDCADLASTFLDLAARRGQPLDRLYRIIANAAGAQYGDHMAAAAAADDGSLWLCGDTFPPGCYPAGVQAWAPVRYQRMSEAARGVWRDRAPWTGGER